MDARIAPGSNEISRAVPAHRLVQCALFSGLIVNRVPQRPSHPGLLRREMENEAMNTTKCNDFRIYAAKQQTSITWDFVTDDGNTPCGCCVRVGDVDPLTGEIITKEIIEEYYRLCNLEAAHNLANERVGYTADEKAQRRDECRQIADGLEAKYGSRPSAGTVRYIQDQRWGSRWTEHLEALQETLGCDCLDFLSALADPDAEAMFAGNEDDLTERMTAFYETLSKRQQDVFMMMLEKYAGGERELKCGSLARKWNVSAAMITKDQIRIRKWMRAYFEKLSNA